MTNPLVTVGVPVYRGQDTLPELLECLRTQSYRNIDVLISVDSDDQASAEACKPFLQQDSRFRMYVQPSRLGWAGNTDWTMRQRRGDFYVYQQHDDLLSPTYIADLVEASSQWPNAVIFFSKMQFKGQERSAPSLLGDPTARILNYLHRLDFEPFRGLIRSSALDETSGLLLSEFDPYDSLGTEFRFMAELALRGEFRFVEGPTYFKSCENLSAKRKAWSMEHRIKAKACWAAWMIEVIAPCGASLEERCNLFNLTLERFAGRRDIVLRVILHPMSRVALHKLSRVLPLRMIRDQLKRSEDLAEANHRLDASVQGKIPTEERAALLRQIFDMLKSGGRFDPRKCMDTTWEALESEMLRRYRIRPS